MFARERPLRRFEKGEQQSILAFTENDGCSSGVKELSTAPFELPTVKTVSTSFRGAETRSAPQFLPAQNGADARQQFSDTKRFGDRVVRTEFETNDAINFVHMRAGCDDDRNIRTGPYLSQEFQSVIVANLQVKNYQARIPSQEVAI